MYEDYEDYNNEELDITLLKGVGVKDIEGGIKVMLMSNDDEIINTYNVMVDLSKLDDNKLCKVCYNISQRVFNLYYENNGELTQNIVENAVRGEMMIL